MSAEQLVLAKPRMFWGSDDPGEPEFVDAIISQLKIDDVTEYEYKKYGNWIFFISSIDWFEIGLKMISSNNINDLFEKMVRFSDENQNKGVRVEYLLQLYVDKLIVFRNNKVIQIKGKKNQELDAYVMDTFKDKTVLAFRTK